MTAETYRLKVFLCSSQPHLSEKWGMSCGEHWKHCVSTRGFTVLLVKNIYKPKTTWKEYIYKQKRRKNQPRVVDHLARGSMKNAANCVQTCELQDTWTPTFWTHMAAWNKFQAMSGWGSDMKTKPKLQCKYCTNRQVLMSLVRWCDGTCKFQSSSVEKH